MLIFLCSDGEERADSLIEAIFKLTKIPLKVIQHFLLENEYLSNLADNLIAPENESIQKRSNTSIQYIQMAKEYLSSIEQYEKATISHFAEFLGKSEDIIYRWLPIDQWDLLRNAWVGEHIKRAMDRVYAEAKSQEDFTLQKIVSHAAMSYTMITRFLSRDELAHRRATLPTKQEYLRSQAEIYLAQTKDYKDVSLVHFAKFLGMEYDRLKKYSFQWGDLQNKWVENHIKEAIDVLYTTARNTDEFGFENIARYTGISSARVRQHLLREWQDLRKGFLSELLRRAQQAMDQLYTESKTREDFTLVGIAKLANISEGTIPGLIQREWEARKATLCTARDKILATIQRLVDANTPLKEFTKPYILEVADVNGHKGGNDKSWLDEAYIEACRQLTLRQRRETVNPPAGANIRIIPDGWIDIDSDTWDLRSAGQFVLRRERLRKDFSEIGWPILQQEMQSPDIALGTISQHYQGFLKGGTVLGAEIPDLRLATLESMQRAWINFDGTKVLRTRVRSCLALIFGSLLDQAPQNETIDATEILRVFTWLRDDIVVGRTLPGEDFLSESELNAVIKACITDINASIAHTNTNPAILLERSIAQNRNDAAIVTRWGIALMILTMVFTGLRRESVIKIKINDWAKIHTNLYILAWHHDKKTEENAAVLPGILAEQLQFYTQRTSQIRTDLKTDLVFLSATKQGLWEILPEKLLSCYLRTFIRRHHLEREGAPLLLNNTLLRRTYTTRALYEGKNPAAVRAMLGHIHLDSTFRYLKLDRYEHPAEVGTPLDEYGRKALTLWRAPLILDELDSSERATLLGVKEKRKQDVGLCRREHCVKAIEGSPPPCSLCEHLVTGPEFLDAWHLESQRRKQDLETLAEEDGSEMMLSQMKYQFEEFNKNLSFIQRKFC